MATAVRRATRRLCWSHFFQNHSLDGFESVRL